MRLGRCLLGVCAFLLVAPAAEAKPSCHGDKATIVGSNGNDVIKASGRADVIVAKGGDDQIRGGGDRDQICAGPGNDSVSAGKGQDSVHGGGGADFLGGGEGSDRLHGQGGDDVFVGGPGGERSVGGAGNDRLIGGLQDDVSRGSAGDDVLVGDHGNDHLHGEEGNDWIRASIEHDIHGGEGTDWASFATTTPYSHFLVAADVNLTKAREIHDIENFVGTPFTDHFRGLGLPGSTVRGLGYRFFPPPAHPEDQCISFAVTDCGPGPGTSGDLPLVSLDANALDPGVHVLGGSADDQLTVVSSPDGVRVVSRFPLETGPGCVGEGTLQATCTVSGPLGYAVIYGSAGGDSLNVASDFGPTTTVVIDGGEGSDQLAGGPGDELLYAGEWEQVGNAPAAPADPDLVDGGGGDDALTTGFMGPDRLQGGPGSDQLVAKSVCTGHAFDGGPGGSDVAGFARIGVRVAGEVTTSGVTARIGGRARNNEELPWCEPSTVSASNEVLEGTASNDHLTGNGQRNFLIIGHGGDDVIRGLGGYDKLRGDEGKDILVGGGGPDVLEARDGERDKRLDCGPGGGRAVTDGKDPRPRRCGRGG